MTPKTDPLTPPIRGARSRRRSPQARRQPESSDAAQPPVSLSEEIERLRLLMRRVEALADDGRPLSELLHILDALGKCSTRIATLLKASRLLENQGDVSESITQALEEAVREIGGGA